MDRIDSEVLRGFRDGLPPYFRTQFDLTHCQDLKEAFSNAIAIKKQFERDRIKHGKYKQLNNEKYQGNSASNNYGNKNLNEGSKTNFTYRNYNEGNRNNFGNKNFNEGDKKQYLNNQYGNENFNDKQYQRDDIAQKDAEQKSEGKASNEEKPT